MNKTGWQITATVAIIGVIALALFIVFRSEKATAPTANTPSSTTDTSDNSNPPKTDTTGGDTGTSQTEWVSSSGNVVVTGPRPNTRVCGLIRVTGRARVFESTLNLRLVDATGTTLAEEITMANAPDMGYFGDFDTTLRFTPPTSPSTGTLMVFDYSARDGSIIDLVEIPVQLSLASAC